MQAIRTTILTPSSSRDMSIRARSRDHTATVAFEPEDDLASNHRRATAELVTKGGYNHADHGELVGAELADGSWSWVPALSADSVQLPQQDPGLFDDADDGGLEGVIDGRTGGVVSVRERLPRLDDPGAFEDEDDGEALAIAAVKGATATP